MAKFKKKKSEPTADSNNSKDDSVEDLPVDIPQTEKSKPVPEPTAEPSVSVAEKSEKDRKLNQLFWLRVALAILAGISATFIFEDIEGEDRRWVSIGFMIGIFFATVIIAKSMKMQLPSSDRKKVVTQAIGSYVFLYLFSWIVSYTLVNLDDVSSVINI